MDGRANVGPPVFRDGQVRVEEEGLSNPRFYFSTGFFTKVALSACLSCAEKLGNVAHPHSFLSLPHPGGFEFQFGHQADVDLLFCRHTPRPGAHPDVGPLHDGGNMPNPTGSTLKKMGQRESPVSLWLQGQAVAWWQKHQEVNQITAEDV